MELGFWPLLQKRSSEETSIYDPINTTDHAIPTFTRSIHMKFDTKKRRFEEP